MGGGPAVGRPDSQNFRNSTSQTKARDGNEQRILPPTQLVQSGCQVVGAFASNDERGELAVKPAVLQCMERVAIGVIGGSRLGVNVLFCHETYHLWIFDGQRGHRLGKELFHVSHKVVSLVGNGVGNPVPGLVGVPEGVGSIITVR